MYNAKASFNKYLRTTILPLLPAGTNLYTSKLTEPPVYPCIIVKYPFGEESIVDYMEAVRVQIDCVAANYNDRQADQLQNLLRTLLKVKKGNGGTAINYNCDDPENLIANGHIKWKSDGKPKKVDYSTDKSLERYIFELNLEYVA